MSNSLRRFIGLHYGIFSVRWKKDEPQNLTQFLSHSRNTLVIMPDDSKAAEYAIQVVGMLKSHFGKPDLTVVAAAHAANLVGKLGGVEIVRVGISDVGSFFLPSKVFLERMRKRHFDLVIDLNMTLSLFAAFLTRKSYSRYRFGFVKPHCDKFYNIQYRSITGQSTQLVYKSLSTFLDNF